MKEFFTKWLREYPDSYPQRYRKNVPFQWVKENGILLMTLVDGESHILKQPPPLRIPAYCPATHEAILPIRSLGVARHLCSQKL